MNVDYISHMGDDLMVVNAARVSFHKESEWETVTEQVWEDNALFGGRMWDTTYEQLKESDVKLIRYLAKNGHWTPFSHPQISLRIKAPIFVARQLYKHKVGMTENEVSRRYVDDPPEFFFPILRSRPEGGIKQGSRDEFPPNLEYCESLILSLQNYAGSVYEQLLAGGVAPEQARMVLPQSMYTEWIWTGSLASYARICKQRLDPHAQAETREIAEQIAKIIAPLFPVSWPVLMGENIE